MMNKQPFSWAEFLLVYLLIGIAGYVLTHNLELAITAAVVPAMLLGDFGQGAEQWY